MIGSIQTGYTVFDAKIKASQPQKDAFTTNVRYLREALAEVCSPFRREYLGLNFRMPGLHATEVLKSKAAWQRENCSLLCVIIRDLADSEKTSLLLFGT